MPASYVKSYVKRGKTDAVDAEAICEAVTRPRMRFDPIKSEGQQAVMSLHRVRSLLVRLKTQMTNAIRSLLREFGVVVGNGPTAVLRVVKSCGGEDYPDIPDLAKGVLKTMCDQVGSLQQQVLLYDKLIDQHSRIDERVALVRTVSLSRMRACAAGQREVGPPTASVIVTTIGDGRQFKNGRELAAWLGLTPLNRSSGGKERLGSITKKGDRYLRRLLVIGMTSQVQRAQKFPDRVHPWILKLLERKPICLATIAMANKATRIIWAVLTSGSEYRTSAA